MTFPAFSAVRTAVLAGTAALTLGAASVAPAEAAPGGATVRHRADAMGFRRVDARRKRFRVARGARHRHVRVGFARPAPWLGAAGVPAGYASDESPYNVGAEDNEFSTGAFYGCLHTVLTAGGYRPVATCD